MLKELLSNQKLIFLIDIILLIVSINCYKYIYETERVKTVFANEAIKFVEENKAPVFRVSKIVLYSSAYAVDHSEEGRLQDIDISQFTDIGIYIDNKGKSEEITAENTINQLFIDNIKITTNGNNNELVLNYKSPNTFGKYVDLQKYEENGIPFKIAHSNDEQMEAGYLENVFFTDCSNPITLGFINKNILTGCRIENVEGEIVFDGSILRNANIDLNSIGGKFNFSIRIKNNLDEDFVCNFDIENNFKNIENGIYSGYVMKIENVNDEKYHFLKVSK